MKKHHIRVFLFVLSFCLPQLGFSQIDSTSIRIPQLMALQNNQNLVSKAIDGAVYLVRQEYQLQSDKGERMGRGILNYFGKEYGIGVLVDNKDMWMPTFVRTPWKHDPNFIQYKDEYTPVCASIKIKKINSGEDYRSFVCQSTDLSQPLSNFKYGFIGLQVSDSLPKDVKLQLYYIDQEISPDDEGAEIKSTTINLKDVKWNQNGKAEVSDLSFKDRQILGGAVFIERISLGRIDIELVALYTREDNNWFLQTVAPIIMQSQSN